MNIYNGQIAVVGLGYIGLPTAVLIANKGMRVYGVDINPSVVESINTGKLHFIEAGLDSLLKDVVDKGLLKATTEIVPSDVYVIVVPTPFRQNHEPDISFVESAVRSVIPVLKKGDMVIIESTSPVLTTEKMADIIFTERPDMKDDIYIAYCPERVLPGNTVYELEHNDRVIGGINHESTLKACSFYAQFVKGNLHETDARTAEMCKLVENSSRDVQIAFANELSMICDTVGINVWRLIELANKHPRVNILQPGSGVGGHCIAVDPWFIVSDYPKQARMIRKAREVNDYKADWCVSKIVETCLKFEIENKRIPVVACMGIAFKPDIDDLRESPAKYITSQIISEARADVLIVEPNICEHKSFSLTNLDAAYQQADIVVWLVRHKEFVGYRKDEIKIELDFCGVRK
jgi:UDP-N-acetyl-D-mannosaminuronic acid dehydrogenase